METQDARQLVMDTKRLSNLRDETMIAKAIGCNVNTFRQYRKNQKHACPEPFLLGEKQRVLWLDSDIDPWIEKMKLQRTTRAAIRNKMNRGI